MDWSSLNYNDAGLVTVVAQDYRSGEIRMLAHANQEALQATEETGFAHFFSRSRARLWMKGESSGNRLHVYDVWFDCDRDAVIYHVEAEGPSCHTGAESCFFTKAEMSKVAAGARCLPVIHALES